ncbi:MAG TPA: hypothetical protein VFR07_04350 [Mycobacteriales bacterium]|jgi:hypothetical protein|nr:hypothetical protein [Mycobacteriales bacterium]
MITPRRRLALLLLCAAGATLLSSAPARAGAVDSAPPGAAAEPPPGPFATLLFSRTEVGLAADCTPDNRGVARLKWVVAPYLASRGMTGTGTLVTGKTAQSTPGCTHDDESLMGSWDDAAYLADTHGWSFVSHTATYPNLRRLTPAQSYAETCGSAKAIDDHGLPGGHGMIAYPGKQGSPEELQATYGAKCFAWARRYGGDATTTQADARTAPYWQNTGAPNGGPCNVRSLPCYTVTATGSSRYALPSRWTERIRALGPGSWLTLQAYVLVTGKSPTDTVSTGRWDCTSADPREHWSNDNERYCYKDYKAIIDELAKVPNLTVTDPLTVGIAFGRPATYPR